MKSADLQEHVAFDAPTESPDGSGGVEIGWNEADAVESRAHFRYLRGGETVQASRLQGRQPVVVTIRNCPDARQITAAWRMRDVRTGKVFNVRTDPVPSDDRRWLEILVEAGVAV